MEELSNKKIAVLGVGQEGVAVSSYLIRHGLNFDLLDEKDFSLWSQEAQNLAITNNLNYTCGPDYLLNLKKYEVVFRSPGIWRLSPELIEAERLGVKITSQAKFFFKYCPSKIIGITGTKGKGTTSSLVYEILIKAKEDNNFLAHGFLNAQSNIYLTGNIGKTQPLDFLDNLTNQDIVVYELSSFQLQDLEQSPHISVVLMTTADHLDKHKSLDEYHNAKQNITLYQKENDFLIFNKDYIASSQISENSPAKKIEISTSKVTNGCQIGETSLSINIPEFNTLEDINIEGVLLRGRHNLENIAAASLAGLCAGAGIKSIKTAISEFKGLEHRLSFIGTKHGASFYDDSIATVPETTIAAINSFSEPTILILGGSEKNSDFSNLAKLIVENKNIKALVIVGQTTEKILQALQSSGQYSGQIFTGARDMEEIFSQIKEVSRSGDVVLLSPACASFGMFKDYKERGDKFIEEVNKL